MVMRFEKVYIELSDFCGLRCGFCPSASREKTLKRGVLDIEFFERICAQVAGKARRVCLHILGDPLAVENFSSYVKILKKHKLKVDLVSTGLFLKENMFELLLQDPFVQVSFSLSAFLANTHILSDRHLRMILSFAKINFECQSPIFINFRFHSADIESQNLRYMDMMKIIAECFSIEQTELIQNLKNKKRVRLGAKVFLVPTKSFEWHRSQSKGLSQSVFCYGANKQIGILSDGRVVPCCIDYEGRASFGHLSEQNLDEILDSQNFRSFAQSLKDGKPPCKLCAQCGYHLSIPSR